MYLIMYFIILFTIYELKVCRLNTDTSNNNNITSILYNVGSLYYYIIYVYNIVMDLHSTAIAVTPMRAFGTSCTFIPW